MKGLRLHRWGETDFGDYPILRSYTTLESNVFYSPGGLSGQLRWPITTSCVSDGVELPLVGVGSCCLSRLTAANRMAELKRTAPVLDRLSPACINSSLQVSAQQFPSSPHPSMLFSFLFFFFSGPLSFVCPFFEIAGLVAKRFSAHEAPLRVAHLPTEVALSSNQPNPASPFSAIVRPYSLISFKVGVWVLRYSLFSLGKHGAMFIFLIRPSRVMPLWTPRRISDSLAIQPPRYP